MMKLQYYRHNKYQPGIQLSAKTIRYSEFTVLTDGAMTYSADGVEYSLTAGDAIYLPCGTLRFRAAIDGCDYVSFNFNCEEEYFPVGILPHVVSATVRHLIAACDGVRSQTADLSDIRFLNLLDCLLRQVAAEMALDAEHPLVRRIKMYVRDHLDRKITLDDIGKAMFFSGVYCDRVFKRETGQSIIDYVIDCRIAEAQLLLSEGGSDLHGVAERVGFSDYNYFSRVFKARVGYPPSKAFR